MKKLERHTTKSKCQDCGWEHYTNEHNVDHWRSRTPHDHAKHYGHTVTYERTTVITYARSDNQETLPKSA